MVWMAILRQAGIDATAVDVTDMASVEEQHGVPPKLSSCHTAVVDGYIISGHVPAEDIRRLLRERPPVVGIGVPGMPIGTPGMPGPNPQPYDVLSWDRAGNVAVYASHAASP